MEAFFLCRHVSSLLYSSPVSRKQEKDWKFQNASQALGFLGINSYPGHIPLRCNLIWTKESLLDAEGSRDNKSKVVFIGKYTGQRGHTASYEEKIVYLFSVFLAGSFSQGG